MALFRIRRCTVRNFKPLALLLAVGLIATACKEDPVSLYPLFDDQTQTFNPGLIGTWAKKGSDETWEFTSGAKKTYRLTITTHSNPSGEELEFEAGLVELAGKVFLDLRSYDTAPTDAPGHVFVRIDLDGDSLSIGFLDEKWLKERLGRESYMTHIEANGKLVLTTPTRDLQYFFRNYAWDNAAFPPDDDEALHRVPQEIH